MGEAREDFKMQTFYKDFGFVIAFMILTLVIEMSMGEKAQLYFLLLVLFSMIVINADDFNKFVDKYFSFKLNEQED